MDQAHRSDDETTPHRAGVAVPFAHEPVMLAEVVALFGPVPEGVVVDATVGGGGHSRAILETHPHLRVVGLDRDHEALDAAAENLASFGDRVSLHHRRFDRLAETVAELGHDTVSGVLFDLGVSSYQIDEPSRGFSYRAEGPLDMRMDRTDEDTAGDLVNRLDERELATILKRYGDEKYASRIAHAIVSHRPITSTRELAEIVRASIPAPARRTGGNPAKRTFQALRIAVNDELAVLERALGEALEILMPRGRGAVLSYHSGEDRIVKKALRHAETGGCECPKELPCACGAVPIGRVLRRGGWVPSKEEIARNPRAKSCRLRAVERLAPVS